MAEQKDRRIRRILPNVLQECARIEQVICKTVDMPPLSRRAAVPAQVACVNCVTEGRKVARKYLITASMVAVTMNDGDCGPACS